MDKSFCIHHQNIQRLLIKIYQALYDNLGNSLRELFVRRKSTINLRSKGQGKQVQHVGPTFIKCNPIVMTSLMAYNCVAFESFFTRDHV